MRIKSLIKTVILDFDDFSTGWSENKAALLEAADGQGVSVQLVRVPEPGWTGGENIGEAARQCNTEVLEQLRPFDFGRFESADLVIASGIDLRNMLALYQWYSDLGYPRPKLVVNFTRTPWHFAEARQDELLAAMKDIFESWPMMFAVSTRFSAATQDLADRVSSTRGFHSDAEISVLPCPPSSATEASALLAGLFPAPIEVEPAPNAVRVLLYVPFGEWGAHHQFEAVMGTMLQNCGHMVHVISCDGLFESCAQTTIERNCLRCQFHHRAMFGPFGLPESRMSAWLSAREIDEVYRWADELDADHLMTAAYNGIPAGEIVSSTLFTQYRITSAEQAKHPEVAATHRKFLAGAVLSYMATDRAIVALKIDRLFLFNGRIYPYKAAMFAARARGLDVFLHERGRVENSFEFFENMNCNELAKVNKQVVPWSKVPLIAEEIDILSRITEKKIKDKIGNWSSFYAGFKKIEKDFFELLNIPKNKKIIGYFTSSADELCQEEGFENVHEQFQIIDVIADILEEEGDEYYLVVRHHPHIGGTPTSSSEITGLSLAHEQQIASSRKNLRVIMPNDPIASNLLYPHLDGAIALYSSVAVELVAAGVPTITSPISQVAATDKRDDLTIIDQLTKENIRKSIKKILKMSENPDKEYFRRCFRSTYSFYGRLQTKFSIVGLRDVLYHAKFGFDSPAQLRPGLDPQIDRLYDRLVSGGTHLLLPGPEEHRRDQAEEDAYLDDRMTAFLAQSSARAEARRGMPPVPTPLPSVLMVDVRQADGEPKRILDNIYGGNHRWAILDDTAMADQLEALRALLSEATEDWVWLGSASFRLNGTFATRVGKALAENQAALAALPLTGWFAVEDHVSPERHSLTTSTPDKLAGLRNRAPGMRDPLSLLGLAVWEKSCLSRYILPALGDGENTLDYLMRLTGGFAGQTVEISEPIFFNS